jgi:hypothetical protein
MKTTMIITAVAMGAAIQVMGADPSASTSKPELTQKIPAAQFANPFAPTKASSSDTIERYGRMSSQPWSQIAAHHEDEGSLYTDAINHEPKIHLFWLGVEPQR